MNISKLIDIARTVGGLISGGAIPTAVGLGKQVIELIDDAKSTFAEDDQAKLQAEADALWAVVKAHEKSTFDKLDEAAKK